MAERLASGRHRLSREQVAAHQRQRLFEALATVMAENGYSRTTVEDLIRAAGVSKATFYQHFSSKQDCFMSAYARSQRHVIDGIEALPATGTPMQRFDIMLDRYLSYLAADPSTARLFLVEVYAAGPEAMRRRVELQQDFVAGVAKVFKARSKADRFACQMLVAAISALATNALADEDAEAALTALKKPILAYAQRVMG
ncbi:TetR/AcrR family transcriptional regulator [Mycolicibacterium vaccae]|uniref:TetR family transcriptional regulator n=1 Tax=Mycolicibacterium vaccae ATCC 25954 TaxID=1194972 RepID=K0VIW1_MYCVA|nr:TetR/AcrR family transcriptional regulator [Mycolicibacterium vaccae]ANI38206.1 TetR family transcriptional regulator [Mycolicibacterium vaccae 95051]EJZ11014.1 TetR family transcriptional regulator [Mycolicibacterium vaccae ATCC 25954]MCV7060148.1 TetR/AcrR family transcriptional regulator [Mycolicibacterium vaccae]